MVKLKFIILITILLLFNSCKSPYIVRDPEIKSKFTNKFGGSNTNIADHIRIDGYYQAYRVAPFGQPGTDSYKELDTTYSNCVFWENGLFFSFGFKHDAGNKEEISLNLKDNIPISREGRIKGVWGIYRIENKIIVVQTLTQAGMSYHSLRERQFEIIDNQTIKLISLRPLQERDIKAYGENPWAEKRNEYLMYNFNKAVSLPEPVSWLKELEWTWENKADWENYMKSINKKKR
jgi:hypothetical protein